MIITWLHCDKCDGVIDPCGEYLVMRKDRKSCKGGGVCVLIKWCFSVVQMVFDNKYAPLEVTDIEFSGIKPKLQIFTVY